MHTRERIPREPRGGERRKKKKQKKKKKEKRREWENTIEDNSEICRVIIRRIV